MLINNAGALFSHRRVTPEGLELTFALNHMAYFVADRSAARQADRFGAGADRLDLVGRARWREASISTTCRAPRATAGSRSTAARSSPISCSPASSPDVWPGRGHGELPPSRRGRDEVRRIERRLRRPPDPFASTVLHLSGTGRRDIVHLASSPEVANTTGGYFVKPKLTEPSAAARDDAAAKRLWLESEKLAGAVGALS